MCGISCANRETIGRRGAGCGTVDKKLCEYDAPKLFRKMCAPDAAQNMT